MSLPAAWMAQARSDYRAAQRLDNHQDPTIRCQAVSKYQQCVEKSIKAILDKLHAAGLVAQGSDNRHPVARYAQTFALIPRARGNRNLLNQLSAALDWHAPAEAAAFSAGEMKRVRDCSGRLMNRLPRILTALDLLYP